MCFKKCLFLRLYHLCKCQVCSDWAWFVGVFATFHNQFNSSMINFYSCYFWKAFAKNWAKNKKSMQSKILNNVLLACRPLKTRFFHSIADMNKRNPLYSGIIPDGSNMFYNITICLVSPHSHMPSQGQPKVVITFMLCHLSTNFVPS